MSNSDTESVQELSSTRPLCIDHDLIERFLYLQGTLNTIVDVTHETRSQLDRQGLSGTEDGITDSQTGYKMQLKTNKRDVVEMSKRCPGQLPRR